MKYLTSLLFLIVLLITAGCVNNNISGIGDVKSDDQLYIESLEGYFNAINNSYQNLISGNLEGKPIQSSANNKVISKTYYEKVLPLKVSQKYELSRNSFLLALKEYEKSLDYSIQYNQKLESRQYSVEDLRKISMDAQTSMNIYVVYLKGAYDTNVCNDLKVKNSPAYTFCGIP